MSRERACASGNELAREDVDSSRANFSSIKIEQRRDLLEDDAQPSAARLELANCDLSCCPVIVLEVE